ncbi:Oxidoreductase UcpA [Zhongshania aliphaticivorans]|uniref:Oxidoreductase UcpA n=1 Tax=Zhongshania aliphaticivorans TaxID=1470434 RepID=A0A5S9NS93_9GAMM|nr:SDR family oxidoreductase [Zhongshania aliphaticivorans]CAA0093505.1 Oxidoreductase UcpA [Zhongshania aliphaticivorans]CAA0111448.1 Oxidoreductase UcpA [Zhongshania aliphaticivorans]
MSDNRKTVFITGASRGIGEAVAKLFAHHGWYVGLYSPEVEQLAAISSGIGEEQSTYKFLDVRDKVSIDEAFAHFSAQTGGRLDVLVNNAGVLANGSFEQIDPIEHDKIIDINIKGATHVLQSAFPLLKSTSNSVVINLCSASSIHGWPQLAVYSASKFYIDGLSEALNIEWSQYGIHVTSIKPPFVKSTMLDNMSFDASNKMTVDMTPEQVANAILAAVDSDKVEHILGGDAKLWAFINKCMPRSLRRKIVRSKAGYV